METAKRVMPFGQTGILRKVSVIKTSQQNLRHLRPDVRTVRATTDWSVKGPPSEKKPTGSTCRNGIDAVRDLYFTRWRSAEKGAYSKGGKSGRVGHIWLTFDNSDQKVLSKSEVDTSAHTFSPSDSGLVIWALTGEPTVHQASCL